MKNIEEVKNEIKKEDKIKAVKASIEKIRPYIQRDGGDVEFVSLTDDNVVYIRVFGACVGCMSLNETLKDGVGALIMDEVPDIRGVLLAEDEGLY